MFTESEVMELMIDAASVVDAFHTLEVDKPLSSDESSKYRERKIFVVGRNELSQALLGKVCVAGLVDDFAKDEAWHGVPVFRCDGVPEGSLVINCSTSISPVSVDKRIRSIPGVRCIPYADLCRNRSSGIQLPSFSLEARQDIDRYGMKFSWIFSRLKDPESRKTFNRLMSYRLTSDYRIMSEFSVRPRDQYFEDFIADTDDLTFVDCGGYDGDTTEQFIARYPNYKRVFLFEPSLKNLERARRRLRLARDIEFFSVGVSDSVGTLFFNADAASASAISASGSTEIEVTTLDKYVTAPISFIKMDLEGWELKALKGAEGHIKRERPILAIAVYHSVSDFWKIPEYVLSISDGYDIYLRHYTEGWSETVMYFVPTVG